MGGKDSILAKKSKRMGRILVLGRLIF